MMTKLWSSFSAWLAARPKLVDWLINHAKKHPYFHIYEDGELYMARFWLIKERAWWLPAVRLHEWHKPDLARDLHDHPRDFRSIVLRGYYVEADIYGEHHARLAGTTHAVRREYFHTVWKLSRGGLTYSLFIYWGKSQMWGFLVRGKKVPWMRYVDTSRYPAEYQAERGAEHG